MGYSQKTLTKLCGLSGNQCAFPGCSMPVIDSDYGVNVSEICHIISASPNGPRHDPDYGDYDRYENLILMCGPHNKIVDSEESRDDFPVERLREFKQFHEERSRNTVLPDDLIARAVMMTLVKLTAQAAMPSPIVIPPDGKSRHERHAERQKHADADERMTYDTAYKASIDVRRAIFKEFEHNASHFTDMKFTVGSVVRETQTLIKHPTRRLIVSWPAIPAELPGAHLLASLYEADTMRPIHDQKFFPVGRHIDGKDVVRWCYPKQHEFYQAPFMEPKIAAEAIIGILEVEVSGLLPVG
jgi:hypothetical protein